jgi:hypothetical protein
MTDEKKSNFEIMLDAAYQAELKVLEELERSRAEKPRKPRPDFLPPYLRVVK